MSTMPKIRSIAGIDMPWILYGTAWKKDRTTDLVVLAVKTGFRGIDTACQPRHYHEPGVGEALSRLEAEGIGRDSLFIQTKFTPTQGQDPETIPYDPAAPIQDQVAQSFETSIKNLGTDHLDSLVLHSPFEDSRDTLEAWRAMERIKSAGGTGQLGISNCYDLIVLRALWDEAEEKPAVLQNRFYRQFGYDRELRAFCREQGIVYQSFWTLTANPHVLKSDTVAAIASKIRKTPSQVFFRFVHQSGILPLTGTTSADHMKQDLAVPGFSLDEKEMTSIEGLLEADA